MTRAQRREANAKPRHLRTYRERLQPEPWRAQRYLQAVAQALVDVGRPDTLVAAVAWRLQAHVKRRGHICGRLFPTRFGGRPADELTPVRVWEKKRPGRLLGARPQQKGLRPLQPRGQARVIRLWQQVADTSPAPQRRWPWTWVADDRVCQKAGQQLGGVGPWSSGQAPRVRLGSEGRRLVVVRGGGPLGVPVDCVSRRPDPVGPGRPGRAPRTGGPGLRERPGTVLQRRCRRLPAPWSGAARGGGASAWLAHVQPHRQGTWLVEGNRRYVVSRAAGRRVTGADLRTRSAWPWRASPQAPGCRSARRPAPRAPAGRVTRVRLDNAGAARVSGLCQETTPSAPRVIRAWGRRRGREQTCRPLKHLWATEAGQVQTEEVDDGHLVWRVLAGLVLFYTARCCWQGRVTREAIVFSLKHPWRFLSLAPLE